MKNWKKNPRGINKKTSSCNYMSLRVSVLLNCEPTVMSQCVPCASVSGCGKGGWFLDHQTRGGDRRPADHTCCDICPSYTSSSLPPHILSAGYRCLEWIQTEAGTGQPERGLASFCQGSRRSMKPLLGSSWASLYLAESQLLCYFKMS